MKFSYPLLLLLLISAFAKAQTTPKWAWVKGDSNLNYNHGVYGTQGIANPANKPGSRHSSVSWKDNADNLWLLGGHVFNDGYHNDLWKYNILTNQWTWVKGDSTGAAYPVYGTQGIPADSCKPAGRMDAVTWKDPAGKFWLFGGHNETQTSSENWLNDLWKYDPLTNQWSWMKGGADGLIYNQFGIYGTKGIANDANKPGSRKDCATWTDINGNLWLFGGQGLSSQQPDNYKYYLNDLWKYDPGVNKWTWINGDNTNNQPGIYGVKGIPDAANKPGARKACVSWTDAFGNFWLFGGDFENGDDVLSKTFDDLWKYDPLTNQWTWMGGHDSLTNNSFGVYGNNGVYGTKGIASLANQPGSRVFSSACTDVSDNFWLFGGNGYGAASNGSLNDVWKYDPTINQWTWIAGDKNANSSNVYGVNGVANTANKPGGRNGCISWSDSKENFWVFGGKTSGSFLSEFNYGDLWKLTTSNLCDWLGTVSDQWENAANWSCGNVPVANTNVYINSGTPFSPVIRSSATCFTLTVSPTATFNVAPGFTITVTGQ